jgi:hypothetical protein
MSMEDAGKSVEGWDLIVLPGGIKGAEELCKSMILMELLRRHSQDRKLFAAIGCSPAIVLASLDGLVPPGATCYPSISLRAKMIEPTDYDIVIQNNLVTAQGNGSALLFALQLGEMLYTRTSADHAARALLVNRDGTTRYTYSTGPAVDQSRGREPRGSVYEDDNAAKNSEAQKRIRDRMDQWRKQNSKYSDGACSSQLEETLGCGDDLNVSTMKPSLRMGGRSLKRKQILTMENESDNDVRPKKQAGKKPGFLEQEQSIGDSESRNSRGKKPANRKRRTPPGATSQPTKSKGCHLMIEAEIADDRSGLSLFAESDSSEHVNVNVIGKQKHSTKTMLCTDCTVSAAVEVTAADDQKAMSRNGIAASDALVMLCTTAPTTSCSSESCVHRTDQLAIIRIPSKQALLDERDILGTSPSTERANEASMPLILNFNSVSEIKNFASRFPKRLNADHHSDSTLSSTAPPSLGPEQRFVRESIIFDDILLPILVTAGWQVDFGRRQTDVYYLPPGIARNTGKMRVDYFDAKSKVVDFLSTNTPWKEMKEISQVIQSYNAVKKRRKPILTKKLNGKNWDRQPRDNGINEEEQKARKRPVEDKTDGTSLTRSEFDTLLNIRKERNRSSFPHVGLGSEVRDVEEIASKARLLES